MTHSSFCLTEHKSTIKYLSVSLFIFAALVFCGCNFSVSSFLEEHSPFQTSTESSEFCSETETELIDEKETARFHEYLDVLFAEDVSANTLNMHYSLNEPKNYGIENYEVTLGEISEKNNKQSLSAMENRKAVLSDFNYSSLAKEDRMSIDVLNYYIDTQLSFSDYYLYDEILKPNTGIQAEFPILLAEFRFNDKQDVLDYLSLLSDVERYFDEIINFEEEKSKAGLFMSDFAVDSILKECSDLCEIEEEHYLITTFNQKISSMDNLSDTEKDKYTQKNKYLIMNSLLPSYEGLSEALTALKGTGKNNAGLCFLPKGKTFYTNLVHQYTGSAHTIEELEAMTQKKRDSDTLTISTLLAQNPNLSSESSSFAIDTDNPENALNYLITQIVSDFPAPVSTDFSVNYVDKCLQDSMAPAFYLTAPIDDLSHNCIYINPAGGSEGIHLFTTLAHEGFPGHLYQTVMSYDAGLSPIRSLLYYPGYIEGWATYVEMMSYAYAGLSKDAATLLSCNQSAILSLYATADMGIHYDGWNLSDTIKFFREYGISDIDTIQNIYEYIIEEPAHYLKYYIGYLEFLELKEYAKTYYGESYSNIKFHQAILSMGPAPFPLLEKYLAEYYQ